MLENKIEQPIQENVVTTFISKYVPYWPLFLITTIILITTAFLFIRYTTPKYEASAKIIIKDEKKGSDDSKMMESFNMISTKKIIENEIEVLQSRKIINNVVKELNLYAPIFQRGKIKDVNAYSFSPVIVEIKNPDSIKVSKYIDFKFNKADRSIIIENKYTTHLNQWINTKYGMLRFIKNKNKIYPNENEQLYFSLYPTKEITTDILKNLSVLTSNKLSSIINLTYKDEVSKRSEDVLNTLIYMYDKAGLEDKNSLAKNTLNFIEERLNIVSKNLDSIEKNVEVFKVNSGSSDLSTQGQLYLQNVSSNDQEIGKINMQLAILEQVNNIVKDEKISSKPMMPSTFGVSDANLLKMMTDLNNKELEYEKLKKTVAEDNPIIISIKDQIESIKPSIVENLNSQKNNLEAGKYNLINTNMKYNSMLTSLPQKEKTLIEMNRDQIIKKDIYSFLLQKREESELSYASTLSDNRIINDALSSKYPVTPNKILIYSSALLASFLICIIIIYLKNNLNNKIVYKNEVTSLTTIPIIGEILYKTTKEELLIQYNKRSTIAEEFRKIRISLHFLGIDNLHKKILITSSIPGEGKSFVAANLAISNAASGKKVILIDVDLHKSGLNELFNKNKKTIGISDYLSKNISEEMIIQQVDKYNNLAFISAGTNYDNASELLLNGKIETLIEYLSKYYDLIIIDTAPTVLITDAFILSKLCDATIYIVRYDFTPKNILKTINENLHINPLKNVGIIFNGIKNNKLSEKYYKYGYTYKNEVLNINQKLINGIEV